jgi:hypothetical protein
MPPPLRVRLGYLYTAGTASSVSWRVTHTHTLYQITYFSQHHTGTAWGSSNAFLATYMYASKYFGRHVATCMYVEMLSVSFANENITLFETSSSPARVRTRRYKLVEETIAFVWECMQSI